MRAKVSVVVPFFNEEENVAQLLVEIRAVGDALGQSYEPIFVNDGSKDATGRRLDEAARGLACGVIRTLHSSGAAPGCAGPSVRSAVRLGQNDRRRDFFATGGKRRVVVQRVAVLPVEQRAAVELELQDRRR